MRKSLCNSEGSKIFYYSNDDIEMRKLGEEKWRTEERVLLSLSGIHTSFLAKMVAEDGKVKLTYNKTPYNISYNKEIPITKEEMKELKNIELSENSLKEVLNKYFNKAKINVDLNW